MADVNHHKHGTLSENSADSGDKPDKNSEDVVVQARHKRRGATISSYASAQDLRAPDAETGKKDGSSPKGVIEASLEGLESDIASPEDSPKAEVRCAHAGALSNWRKLFKLWKRKSEKPFSTFPQLAVPRLSRKNNRSKQENPMLRKLYNIKSSLENFSLSRLRAATDNFNQENIIGRGGYAEVYKGRLKDGKLIAIKRLTKGAPDERTAGFLSELGIIAHVNHPNTAKLIGCCVEGGMHLVFQLSPLGNLRSALHGSKGTLDWSKRYKIALGTADGLTYLHETCERRIIHRDIKADNILLTENFEPQICDFGLAKWLPRQWTHYNVSKFEGTFGYFAPEYFMHGIVDEKTDVYAFGVLLLELITGRKALDDQQQSVVIWAKPLLDENDIKELVDPSLGDNYDVEEVERMVLTASLCIEQSPLLRPQMSQVVILLRGDDYVAECSNESQHPSHQRTYSNEIRDTQEYNSTKHINNINRLREIALGS
ncbi:hypothetical protein E1A91_D11G303000v1 [Gossypium mustelinum]|uniref:non-specific serine/threonine protein kinase n=1 Tax=Gossypium mustelinum TaxID=34275 RepID=A0A5D2SYI3_GOSMU|nr:hypothetical protein E1A91_D11G303000v1 [Gossypium mustelinum]